MRQQQQTDISNDVQETETTISQPRRSTRTHVQTKRYTDSMHVVVESRKVACTAGEVQFCFLSHKETCSLVFVFYGGKIDARTIRFIT